MPLNDPIITIALSRADLAERRAESVPDLVGVVLDRLRALGDPEEVCAAYVPSLTAALGAWWDEHFTCTEAMHERAAGETGGMTDEFDWHRGAITRATPVTRSYRNTQNVRRFLRSECGADFKFDRPFMAWIKNGTAKTMGDVADEWRRSHGGDR